MSAMLGPRWRPSGNARWILAAMAAVALLAWAFRDVDPASTAVVLGRARPGWLAAALALDLLVIFSRSLKWRCLLPAGSGLRQSSVFSATAIGIMLNGISPVRLDEAFRALFLSRRTGLPAATVLGTIVLERIWDGLALAAAVVVLGTLVPLPATLTTAAALALAMLALLLAVAGTALLLDRAVVRVPEVVRSFSRGLAVARGARAWLAPPMICGAEWVASAAFLVCVGLALQVEIPVRLAFALHAAHAVSFAVGLLPGGIGLMESLDRVLIAGWGGIARDEMLALVVLYRVMLSVPPALLGLVLARREGLTLTAIARFGRQTGRQAPESAGASAPGALGQPSAWTATGPR